MRDDALRRLPRAQPDTTPEADAFEEVDGALDPMGWLGNLGLGQALAAGHHDLLPVGPGGATNAWQTALAQGNAVMQQHVGRPARGLPPSMLREAEGVFGRAMDHVAVRIDAAATEAARAHAFAQGQEIVVHPDAWAPGTAEGRRRILHELVHVDQFERGLATGLSGLTGAAHALEAEARAVSGHGASAGVVDGVAPAGLPILRDAWTEEEERAYGLDDDEHDLTASTVGLWNLRATPAVDGVQIGALNGQRMQVTVTREQQAGEHVWYEVQFSENDWIQVAEEAYLRATVPGGVLQSTAPQASSEPNMSRMPEPGGMSVDPAVKARNVAQAQGLDAHAVAMAQERRAWVVGEALTLRCTLEQFLTQLRAWEAQHPDLSVLEKITMLRQASHDSDLPFDGILGAPRGETYADDRVEVSGVFQLLREVQVVVMPDGNPVDVYHLLVGLEGLQPERMDPNASFWGMDMGPSIDAATWAGDIGAGVSDANQGASSAMEAWFAGLAGVSDAQREALRTAWYFWTRAPESDLFADVDAWGFADQVPQAQSLADLIASYYGAGSLRENRARAVGAFLHDKGFTSTQGLEDQPAAATVQERIRQFARVWERMKHGVWFPRDRQLAPGVEAQAALFLQWLEAQAAATGATLPSSTGVGGVGAAP